MAKTVALLGLGGMGQGIGGNLLRAGFRLVVYNRTASKAAPLVAGGAVQARSARDAAESAEIIISITGNDESSKAIWLGDRGALGGAKQGTILVESSTLSVSWIRDLALLAHQHCLSLLDAPVIGSTDAAEAGQLAMMIGGEREVADSARPILEAYASEIHYMGSSGCGAAMKLVHNLMAAVQVVALAEGLALAERSSLDPNKVMTVIVNGSPGSPIVRRSAVRMVERNYGQPRFLLRWMHKDAAYAVQAGEEVGLHLGTVQAAMDSYGRAIKLGLGEAEFSAVVEELRQRPARTLG